MLYKGYRFTVEDHEGDELITLFDDSNKTQYSVLKQGLFLFHNLAVLLDDLIERAETVRNTPQNNTDDIPF